MSVHDELRKLGFEFQYEHGDAEDRTEVWLNRHTKMAVRIEWFKVDEEPTADRFD